MLPPKKPDSTRGKVPKLEDGDYYFDGLYMVFTSKYHQKRGVCCQSGCRHCPFRKEDTKKSG